MTHGRLLGAVIALMLFSSSAVANEFPAVPGEYVVKLKNAAVLASNPSSLNSLGKVSVINAKHGLVLAQRPVIETRSNALQTLNNNPLIEYAEPNFIYHIIGSADQLPNDPELGRLWGLINDGQGTNGDMGDITGKADVDIDADKAWAVETGSKEVIVAVIDTGVDYENPDLAANIFVNEAELNGEPGVDDDGNGCIDDIHGCDFSANDGDPQDGHGHGTHVSGTIGASANNGLGVVGVAWNVRILPVRFLGNSGGGSLADAIKAIDYATTMGAHIMNNSWGGGGYSQALYESIVRARDAGILFVAAAGNNGSNLDQTPTYPASYEVENVMAVAAIEPTGALASFSNYGRVGAHIAAPGANILSYTKNGLESWSGTSMAAPHVSGVAALLLSQDMEQTYDVLKNRMMASARPMATLRNKVQSGLLNAYYALTNQVAPIDLDDPFYWQKMTEEVSTDHPYEDNFTQTWTFTVPGATKVAVYFSKFETERGYDVVTFTDADGKVYGTLSGNQGETFGPTIDGDTVVITFRTDGSVQRYGFDISGIAYK